MPPILYHKYLFINRWIDTSHLKIKSILITSITGTEVENVDIIKIFSYTKRNIHKIIVSGSWAEVIPSNDHGLIAQKNNFINNIGCEVLTA